MAVDLSSLLSNPPGGAAVAALKGVSLPTLVISTFSAVPPSGCVGCLKASDGASPTHKCWQALKIDTPLGEGQDVVFDIQNDYNDWFRRASRLADVMHMVTNGIAGFGTQQIANATNQKSYDVVSASGNRITLYWDGTASTDPTNLPQTVYTLNSGWLPGAGSRWNSTTTYWKLRARGILTIGGDGMLTQHAGFIIRKIDCNLTGAGNFDVHLDTPCGPYATVVAPNSAGSSHTAAIEFYVDPYVEGWANPRDVFPLWGAEAEYEWESGDFGNQVFFIVGRCRWHDNDSRWVHASARQSGTDLWDDISTTWHNGMSLIRAAGRWYTQFDLSAVDLTAYDKVTLNVWLETTKSAGQYVGQRTCANDRIDYSDSWGRESGGKKWFCSKAASASHFSEYNPGNCYLAGRCDQFAEDQATTPHYVGGMEQLTHSVGLRWRQATPSIPEGFLERMGPPGMLSLCPTNIAVPTTLSAIQQAVWYGGWNRIKQVGGVPTAETAFECDWDDGTDGPAGGNVASRKKQSGDVAEDRDVMDQQITMSSVDFDPREIEIIENSVHGGYQRCAIDVFDLVCPQIDPDVNVTEFEGGSLLIPSIGGWDANLSFVYTGIIYSSVALLAEDFDVIDRGMDDNVASTTRISTVTVTKQTSAGSNDYWLELENQVIECESLKLGGGENWTSHWRSGGTNVAIPEPYRVNNERTANNYGRRGSQMSSTAQVGDVAVMTDSSFGVAIKNKQFEITDVEAATGDQGDWFPGTTLDSAAFGYDAIFIPYDAGTESLTVFNYIKRDSDGTTLVGPTVAESGYPFPTSLAVDTYVFTEFTNENNVKGILLKVSHLNADGTAAMQDLHINFTTDAKTYDIPSLDLINDATYGQTALNGFDISTSSNISSIDVEATYPDPDTGQLVTTTLYLMPLVAGNYSVFGATNYMLTVTSPTLWTIFVPMQLAGATITVRIYFTSTWSGTNAQYYSTYIDGHGTSLPSLQWNGEDYEDYGRRRDRIKVQDEMGLIAALGANGLVGKTIKIKDSLIARHGEAGGTLPTIKVATAGYNDATADTTLVKGTHYDYHGAQGQIYFKRDWNDGECLYIEDIALADRSRMPMVAELTSIRSAFEEMMEN